MRTFLYGVWFLFPLLFFIIALWSKLGALSDKHKGENSGDLLKQGVFVLACALLAVLVDQYLLQKLVDSVSPDWIPLGFYQALLLPIIFLIVGKLVGKSAEIRISRTPHPSERRRRKR